MKRRDVLKIGAVGIAGASGAEAASVDSTPRLDPAAVEASLNHIDKRMKSFLTMDLFPRAPKTPQEADLFARQDRLTRTAMRTLYFTGAFNELEEQDRAHPGVQERIRRMQGEMDEAVDGMTTFLESLTPAQHQAVQEQLQADPDLGKKVGDVFQKVAKDDGFGFLRRLDLRVAFDDVAQKMRVQNPALLIDSQTRKVRRIQATAATDAERERATAVRAGEQAFWDFQERNAKYLGAWDEVYSKRPRADVVALEGTYDEIEVPKPDDPTRRPKTVLSVGGYIMGFGGGSALTGLALYGLAAATATTASASPLYWPSIVLGVTVGPVLLVVGLVVVIVGAIWYGVASSKEQPEVGAPKPPRGASRPADPQRQDTHGVGPPVSKPDDTTPTRKPVVPESQNTAPQAQQQSQTPGSQTIDQPRAPEPPGPKAPDATDAPKP
jgi:hypothetical protein